MLNSLILKGLNDAQREAVLHGEGPAMVVAGPGSGKTLTIIRRLLYLIYERKIPADKILVITYTKEAAFSMQQKFYEQKDQFFKQHSLQGYVSFGTFHSFFYQIIKNIKTYSEYQLITPQEKVNLAKSILSETQDEVSDFEVKRFLEQVSYFKNTGKYKNKEDINTLFVKYQESMRKYHRMDYDDMLFLCKQEFTINDSLLNTCRNRYEYILIDEYQDINPIQYELIHLLTMYHQNIFVVGDDDQAIYAFRGSDISCFQKFLKDYQDTVTIYLNINYRCFSKITETSQFLISHNKNRLAKNIIPISSGQKGNISIIESESTREMNQLLMERLKNQEILQLNNSAILFRTNAMLQSFANMLAGRGIPFVIREKIRSIYEHFIVCDILDFCKAAIGCRERALILRICKKLNISLGRALFMEEQVDFQILKKRVLNSFYDNPYAVEQIDILVQHLNRLLKLRPSLGITYILHAMGYERYLLGKAGNHDIVPEDWSEVLYFLKEDAECFEDCKSWLKHHENSKEEMNIRIKSNTQNTNGVHLMTMHAAKGLEFDTVYILPLNDGIIPKLKRGLEITEDYIEEERRLFYVALTRAKATVELYYVTGSKENPRLKSRFLEEIIH